MKKKLGPKTTAALRFLVARGDDDRGTDRDHLAAQGISRWVVGRLSNLGLIALTPPQIAAGWRYRVTSAGRDALNETASPEL